MRFLLFISVAVSVYATMHAVVLWGVHPLLVRSPHLPLLTTGWMGLMVLAPLAAGLLHQAGLARAARGLAWVAYAWLGLLFLAFSLSALLGSWELLVWFGAKAVSSLSQASLHGPRSAKAVCWIALGFALYGFHEARRLRVERVDLVTPKLGPSRERLRLVQVSDLHLGLLHREAALTPVIALLEELKPDLLVATGDVVDAHVHQLHGLGEMWRRITPPLGKYAVVGNHEVYAGLEQSLVFLRRCGFRVLRNEGLSAGGEVAVMGVDDAHVKPGTVDEGRLFGAQPPEQFTIFLKHRPEMSAGASGRFDLQLSGHTHLGQIFPFRLVTGLRYPLQNGLYALAGGGHLYTSRGAGSWGPPMRVFSPPEITCFEIRRAAEGTQ